MKVSSLQFVFLIALYVFAACPSQQAAEEDEASASLRAYQLNDQKYLLLEQEKQLLQATDSLETRIFEIKKQMKTSGIALEAAYHDLRIFKQKLNDVQLELRQRYH